MIQPWVVKDPASVLNGEAITLLPSVAESDYSDTDYILFNRNFPTKADKMFIAFPLRSLGNILQLVERMFEHDF